MYIKCACIKRQWHFALKTSTLSSAFYRSWRACLCHRTINREVSRLRITPPHCSCLGKKTEVLISWRPSWLQLSSVPPTSLSPGGFLNSSCYSCTGLCIHTRWNGTLRAWHLGFGPTGLSTVQESIPANPTQPSERSASGRKAGVWQRFVIRGRVGQGLARPPFVYAAAKQGVSLHVTPLL